MPTDREGCCPSVLSWPAGAGRPRDCVRAGEAGTRPARGPRPRAVSGVPASRRGRGARIRRGLDRPWDAGANLALVGGDARMVEARDALAEQHRPIAGADRGLSDGGRGDHLDGHPALQPDTVNRRELPGVAGGWMERPVSLFSSRNGINYGEQVAMDAAGDAFATFPNPYGATEMVEHAAGANHWSSPVTVLRDLRGGSPAMAAGPRELWRSSGSTTSAAHSQRRLSTAST